MASTALAETARCSHGGALDAEETSLSGSPLIGTQHALLSGSVISINDEAVSLSYSGAVFVIQWGYDDSKEANTRIFRANDNTLRFMLLNCNSSVGISYVFNAGRLDGKPVELRVFVHSIGTKEHGVSRLVSYTLAYTSGGGL
jgi:hypothetical protein